MMFQNSFLIIKCSEFSNDYNFESYEPEKMGFSNIDWFKSIKDNSFILFRSGERLFITKLSLDYFISILSNQLFEDSNIEYRKNNLIEHVYDESKEGLSMMYNPIFPQENETLSW